MRAALRALLERLCAWLARVPGQSKALFDRLCAWMHKVVSDDAGNVSSIRLVMLLWHFAVAAVWVFLCIVRRELVHIDESVLSVLGGTLGFKLGQKPLEAKPATLVAPSA